MSRKIDPQFAEAKMIAVGLQPLEPYKNAVSDWRCRCLTCNEIVVSRYNRVQQGSSCPRCAATNSGIKMRLSQETAATKLKEYDLEPLEPYVKSDAKWKCRCLSCGEIVFPKLKNLQRGAGGCYKCGMKNAGLKNTLSQEDAIRIVTKAGFEPLEPYKNALAKWRMRHEICGAIVHPKLNSLLNLGESSSGCAVCSGKQVERGFNDLLTTHPMISSQAVGWDPSKFTQGSNQKKEWKCSLQHRWLAKVSDRALKSSDCPTCSISGFDPNSAGHLYFLEHPDWEMFQIGITNFPVDRLRSHKRIGWELREMRGPMDGHLARQWETAMLRMLKAKGADLANAKIAGKFDGYSEAWSKSTFEVNSIKELMRMTNNFEEGI
jgi:hypothetical protein